LRRLSQGIPIRALTVETALPPDRSFGRTTFPSALRCAADASKL
jgi:hypothetical protein